MVWLGCPHRLDAFITYPRLFQERSVVHPFKRRTVQSADTAHSQLHYVCRKRRLVPDSAKELQETPGEIWGYQKASVEWSQSELAALLHQLLDPGLVCWGCHLRRVISISEAHLEATGEM
jgi:hypothetical protein